MIIVVVGPTGVGKTKLSIELAKKYNAEIINGDSMQVYKGLDIGTAKVTEQEKEIANMILKEISNRVGFLVDVGLEYLTLARMAMTLSGGESQRVKLAYELQRRSTGNTLYILDEPTTGLHTHDIRCLLDVLNTIVSNGNSVVVIEHNLDVIKCADYIIDLGPEGGDNGGNIVCQGTPEEVSMCEQSYTGKYLKKILERERKRQSR